ncbi:cyclin-dependent kinase inhibitor 1-like [Carassius auratus]|uniref:Cyclin-dependent kinase inhibitor 1-like n=1 Tax=Carassius auratus TaxID=7957 RepID=A0A6P6N4V1_CARAU|nr:cyclin-dependent kinase inhibitor 1-like [Carassius auratus]
MAMDKRILQSLGNSRTRRNLFGPVDHEQLQLEYLDALRKDLEEASRRWSFDFLSETPLEGGDFLWEGVSEEKLPVLYRGSREVQPRGKENILRIPKRFSTVPQDVEKTPEKRSELKRKQTNITDFYQAKKRQVATPRKSGQ